MPVKHERRAISPPEFTTLTHNDSLLERFLRWPRVCCSRLGATAHLSGQKLLTFQGIYHMDSIRSVAGNGKLGEGSDKSAPMIGIRTQSWDRRKHWPPDELVPRVHCVLEMEIHGCKELLMSETGIRGIDLFKIAGESISGWIPSWKMGGKIPTRQPFCSLMEERLLLYLEYHPQVAWYGRGDISATFASTYKIATPQPVPFTINYLFEGKAHVYLPDAIGQLQSGSLLIAEAGLEREKRRERNQAKAEAARKVAEQQGGVYWIGTEASLLPKTHANLVFLHARRQPCPSFQALAEALQVVWPYGEAACVQEVIKRLGERWSKTEKEAAVW